MQSGLAAPWYGQPGFGIQYFTGDVTIEQLIRDRFIR